MNIIELKKQIENKTLDDSFFILKYDDSSFIAKQYIEEIASFKNKEIVYVDSFESTTQSVFGTDNCLYVMFTDKITKVLNTKALNNKIVVCKSIDPLLVEDLKDFVVDIPKLQQWQIKTYITKLLPGLSADEINWLVETCKDINRLVNEAEKISIFHKAQQQIVFRLLNDEDAYADLNSTTIFNFTNAITKRNKKEVQEILESIENMDVEPMGVVTILYKSFRNIIDIQMSQNPTPESVNMSPKQFSAVKYNCGKFSNDELIKIFDLITLVDSQLKSGNIPNEKIVDYLLINIL